MSEDPSIESEEQSGSSEQEVTEEPTCVWTSLLVTDLEDSIAELKSLLETLQEDISSIKSTVNSLKNTIGTNATTSLN